MLILFSFKSKNFKYGKNIFSGRKLILFWHIINSSIKGKSLEILSIDDILL